MWRAAFRGCGVQVLAFYERDEIGIGARGGMIVEAAPAFYGRQIDHDDSGVDRLVGGIGDECHAFFAAMEIEADVVQIGGGQRNVRGEQDFFDDLIGLQIYGQTFWAAGSYRAELNAAGIENPESLAAWDRRLRFARRLIFHRVCRRVRSD